MTEYLTVTENVIPQCNYIEFDRRCSTKAVHDAFEDIAIAAVGFIDASMSFAHMHKKSVEDTKESLACLKESITRLEKQLGW